MKFPVAGWNASYAVTKDAAVSTNVLLAQNKRHDEANVFQTLPRKQTFAVESSQF